MSMLRHRPENSIPAIPCFPRPIIAAAEGGKVNSGMHPEISGGAEESRLRSRRRAALAASFHRQNDREDGQGEERQEEAQEEAQERLPAKASS
jgi:hypothetical protein